MTKHTLTQRDLIKGKHSLTEGDVLKVYTKEHIFFGAFNKLGKSFLFKKPEIIVTYIVYHYQMTHDGAETHRIKFDDITSVEVFK